MATPAVRAFSVWHVDRPEWAETVNARSAGAAKYDRWRSIREAERYDRRIAALEAENRQLRERAEAAELRAAINTETRREA